MVLFYKIWKKYNEIQLTKKMDLNKLKNNKSSTLPRNNNDWIWNFINVSLLSKMLKNNCWS